MDTALFLDTHPAWTPRDYAESDRDVIDLMRAIREERNTRAVREQAMADSMSRALASRSH